MAPWLKLNFFWLAKLLILLSLLSASIVLVYSLTHSQPLVHDEAVYLTKARSWVSDTPASEFRIYRPIGLVVTGWVLLHFNDTEQFLRLVGVVFAFCTTLLLFLLVHSLYGLRAASLSVLLMLSSGLFLQNAPNFLNDIPSAGFIFGILWVLWKYFETSGKSKFIYLLPVFIGMAFYLRYGAVINFAAIGVATTFLLLKKFLFQKQGRYSGILWATLLTLLILVPFFSLSISTGNGLIGVLLRGGGAAGRKFLGEGLVEYIKLIPYDLGGWVFGFFVLLGIIFTVMLPLLTRLRHEKQLGIFWVGSIAILHLLISGLLIHAEPRYIFFSATLLGCVGVIAMISLLDNVHTFVRWGAFIVVVSAILCSGAGQYIAVDKFFDDKVESAMRASYVLASKFIEQDNPSNEECAIWSAMVRPEMSWYSRCYTLSVGDPLIFYKEYLIHLRRDKYSVVFTGVSGLQINDVTADQFGIVLEKIYEQNTNSSLGNLIIYRAKKENPIDSKLREEMSRKAAGNRQ